MEESLKDFGISVSARYGYGIARLSIYIPPNRRSAALNVKIVGWLEENGWYVDRAASDGMDASKSILVDDFVPLYKLYDGLL